MIGRRLLHYEIAGKLGEGGMGVVYKARDTHLDRFVAIKVLPPEKVSDPDRKARFIREAKAASALNHPNIITIHDIANENGTDFIAMEFVDGKTLDQLIPRKGMRLNEALKAAIQIADALARAHEAGIIHRDIKPANIMVDGHGQVKVLDFGLAKLTEQGDTAEASTATAAVKTEEGTIAGTAAYMSPEQAEGKPLDARSDIFSFGSVLYEMLTGQRAFQGDSKMSTLSAVLQKEPDALSRIESADLRKLVARCLRKIPERRIQHMDDVKVGLVELKEDSDSDRLSVMEVRPAIARRFRFALAAIPVALTVVAVIWFVVASRREATPDEKTSPLTSFPGYETSPTFSPDGSQVAFSWDGDARDNTDVYVTLTTGGKPLRLTTDPAEDFSPAWSPSGGAIAFLRRLPGGRSAVLLAPPLGGTQRKVGEIVGPEQFTKPPWLCWNASGDALIVSDKQRSDEPAALFLLSIETGLKQRLTAPPPGQSIGDVAPALSPGGDRLVFVRTLGWGVADLYSMNFPPPEGARAETARLTTGNWNCGSPAWLNQAEVLFYSTNRGRDGLWRIGVTGGETPRRVPIAAVDILTLAYSPRALRLVLSHSMDDRNLWRVDLPGGRLSGPIAPSTRLDYRPALSPDGSRIAFSSERSGSQEIWVASADGLEVTQLTSLGASTTTVPAWSPDGEKIAFHSNVEGQFEVFVIEARGGRPVRLTRHPGVDGFPSWSRDGRYIYFRSTRSGRPEVWKTPAQSGDSSQVTWHGGFYSSESPDGQWLYYTKSVPGFGIWRIPTAGGQEVQVFSGLVGVPPFVVFDDGIYFIHSQREAAGVLSFLDLRTNRVKPLHAFQRRLDYGLSVSSDRRWVLFAQYDQEGSDLMLVENFR